MNGKKGEEAGGREQVNKRNGDDYILFKAFSASRIFATAPSTTPLPLQLLLRKGFRAARTPSERSTRVMKHSHRGSEVVGERIFIIYWTRAAVRREGRMGQGGRKGGKGGIWRRDRLPLVVCADFDVSLIRRHKRGKSKFKGRVRANHRAICVLLPPARDARRPISMHDVSPSTYQRALYGLLLTIWGRRWRCTAKLDLFWSLGGLLNVAPSVENRTTLVTLLFVLFFCFLSSSLSFELQSYNQKWERSAC